MGLSDDQRAMLRLLAQREQGYEDIAALMGLSVEEVRARVAEALAQLEDEGAAGRRRVPAPERRAGARAAGGARAVAAPPSPSRPTA